METKDGDGEKETLKDKVENMKETVSEKAGEFAKDARESAEKFAGKTFDGVEKLINDVFNKNKSEEAEFVEEVTDPKEIEVLELKKELEELRDKYVRLFADFDNYKKRNARERLDLIQVAGREVIQIMLPVLDDFERAMKSLDSTGDVSAAKEGMNLIYNKMNNALQSKGLKAMKSVGEEFKVENHEAITEIPVSDNNQVGKVIDEVEKGYYLNEKIIRFAKVVVGKKAE